MSLFGSGLYQWRETYFVMFHADDRPSAEEVVQCLNQQHDRLELTDVNADDQGKLESLTVRCHEDASAMDITYVAGEEVAEQTEELLRQMAKATLNEDDREKLNFIGDCTARFDIFHFEELTPETESDDEFLDPGALLLVMDQLTRICRGVAVDPQSGSLM